MLQPQELFHYFFPSKMYATYLSGCFQSSPLRTTFLDNFSKSSSFSTFLLLWCSSDFWFYATFHATL